MDRFTIAGDLMIELYLGIHLYDWLIGVLDKIEKSFKIGDAEGGLLQTLFVCSYMALAPLFGYLG